MHKAAIFVAGTLLLAGCASRPAGPGPSSSPAPSSASVHLQPDWSAIPGALVNVSMESTVGVLLDEIPEAQRARLVRELTAKPEAFWVDRAKRQIRLTTLRLHFRNKGDGNQLPLPPEQLWSITLNGAPRRERIQGHDVVVVDYAFSGMLLSDVGSPGETEPVLGKVGGVWTEQFTFPVDPELIFQRTGFACMNESQFPPNSVDAEESDLFFDDHCGVEKRLSNTACHQTQLPTRSCVQALAAEIGPVKATMSFKRLPWDKAVADGVRLGEITNPDGPDLVPDAEEFRKHRFTYRYIPQNSCTLVERCVGGSGWRKLLMFPTADLNAGAKALDIGDVDYFHKHGGTILSEHGMFELSACHGHYHFSQYGTFRLGGDESITRKNGFCMQPTARLTNHELSPLHHPYTDCINQGVAAGWIDEYKMGLECQWLDVSGVRGGQTLPLSFTTNPDGVLCEGTLKRDTQGHQLFEPTPFKTSTGQPVDQPQCERFPGWLENNTDSYDVQVPEAGESYVTGACREGLVGPLRNCGFRNTKALRECAPGKKVILSCSAPSGSASQVVRVCEGSRGLATGIPCTANDALGLGIVDQPKDITFTCPDARGGAETGGAYAFMTAPLFPEDAPAEVTCEVNE